MEELPAPWNRTVTWIDSSDKLEDNHDERFGYGKGSENVGHVGASNRAEVDLICHMLRNLVENDNALEQLQGWFSSDGVPPIGIIAGYRKQVTAIQDRLDTDCLGLLGFVTWLKLTLLMLIKGQKTVLSFYR